MTIKNCLTPFYGLKPLLNRIVANNQDKGEGLLIVSLIIYHLLYLEILPLLILTTIFTH